MSSAALTIACFLRSSSMIGVVLGGVEGGWGLAVSANMSLLLFPELELEFRRTSSTCLERLGDGVDDLGLEEEELLLSSVGDEFLEFLLDDDDEPLDPAVLLSMEFLVPLIPDTSLMKVSSTAGMMVSCSFLLLIPR